MPDNFLKTEKVYSVLELNNAVRSIIKDEFSEAIWVCGEIQDFRASKDKRHIYFNLAQKHPEIDQIVAEASAAIFEGRKAQIFKSLQEADSNFELKNDIEVKLKVEVDFYPKRGSFTLIVVDIDPVYTFGKIAQSRQKILEDLKKQGFLDKNKRKNIPLIPLKIGLITSYDSAAYHDFTKELKSSGYGFKVLIHNAHMQGEFVENDIVKALEFFSSFSASDLDAIVITRGGGSTADLSWFDNKIIAQNIAQSNFPVISALGHEINITIADMVAHTSLKTPTKAAQFLIERVRTFMDELNYLQERVLAQAQELVARRKKELEAQTLKIDSLLQRYFRFRREELFEKKHLILLRREKFLADKRQNLAHFFEKINFYLDKFFKDSYRNLRLLEEKVKLLDPKNILSRGYSITLKGEKAVKNIDQINEDDLIRTLLYKGSIISKVERKEKANG